MPAATGGMRLHAVALVGVVERNAYLVKRYGWWELAFFVWTVASTPFAMKTIVSVLATVHTKNASSHQPLRFTR